MTALDLSRPHIVTAPHQVYGSGMWFAWCTCGEEFSGTSPDTVRDAGKPHRDAERTRTGALADQERIQARQLRVQAGRAQRKAKESTVERGGAR